LQNLEGNNNNDVRWKRTPPLSRSKTLPDLLLQQEQDGCVSTSLFSKGLLTQTHATTHEIHAGNLVSDSPAPQACKSFPKTPKIALTIDDIPQSEYQRRKSSGSSVNSTSASIEPHIYDFQEYEKSVESSLVIRFVAIVTFTAFSRFLKLLVPLQDSIVHQHSVGELRYPAKALW